MTVLRPLRRYFLPSRIFGRYLARIFFVRFIAIAIGVAVVLQMLELLDQADTVLAGEGNDSGALWRYVGLRFPDFFSRFIPFSALLSVLLSLASLQQHSELTVMRAAGLSTHRILLPIGLVCAAVAIVHFFFNERIVAPARAELAYWERYDYAADLPLPPDVRDRVWLTEGRSVIRVEAVSRSGDRVILDRVTIHERDEAGLLGSIVRADFAWHMEGVWTLFSVRRFDLSTLAVTAVDSQRWDLNISPERFFSLSVVPEQVPYWRLHNSIQQLEREGLPTVSLRASLLQKIAEPAAILLMPVLGALAGCGARRRGHLFARTAIGMGLGFAFFVTDNFMLAMGKFGAVPPLLAAFGPMLLFLSVGFAMLFHIEE